MRRFGRLYRNEWQKLFARPLVYIMFAAIFLVTLAFGFIFKQDSYYTHEQTYDEYLKDWRSYAQSEIGDLEAQKKDFLSRQENGGAANEKGGGDVMIYKQYGEGYSSESPAEGLNAGYYDEMIANVRYCLENGIDGGSWKRIPLDSIAVLKSELSALDKESAEAKEKQAKIDKYMGYIERGDWRGYLTYDFESAEFDDSMKAVKNARAETLRLRLAYDIVPFNQPYSNRESVIMPWREQVLQKYEAQFAQLESGQNDMGGVLGEQEKKKYGDSLKKYEYRLKEDIPPIESQSFMGFLDQSNSLIMVVSLCVIILAATQVASEYTSGTVKLLLIAPYKRWKILLAKCALMFTIALLMYGALLFSAAAVGGMLYGFGGMRPFVTTFGGEAAGVPFPLFVLLKYFLNFPELLVYTSLAVMLAVLMRHSAVAIGLGVALLIGGGFVNILLQFIKYDFKRFILQANTNLGQYFTGFYENDIFSVVEGPPIPDMTLGFSLAVLAVYLICINAIAFDSFNRRDIK